MNLSEYLRRYDAAAERAESDRYGIPLCGSEPDDRYVSESDMPVGAYDDDQTDMEVMFDCYVNGRDF